MHSYMHVPLAQCRSASQPCSCGCGCGPAPTPGGMLALPTGPCTVGLLLDLRYAIVDWVPIRSKRLAHALRPAPPRPQALLDLMDSHISELEEAAVAPKGPGARPPRPLPLRVILSTPTGSGKTFTAVMTHLQVHGAAHRAHVHAPHARTHTHTHTHTQMCMHAHAHTQDRAHAGESLAGLASAKAALGLSLGRHGVSAG
jgi:hypothetical protein